jgi:hypothetical protein
MRTFLAALTGALLLGACGTSGASQPGTSGDLKLSVTSPASGANVSMPFTVKVTSSVPLGTTETGLHHIHIWFDGNDSQYQISYTDTAEVTNAPAGTHTMTVSLRNANHSDAGPRVDVPVTVGGTGAVSTAPTDDPY